MEVRHASLGITLSLSTCLATEGRSTSSHLLLCNRYIPNPPCGRCQTRADEAVSVTCCVFNCSVLVPGLSVQVCVSSGWGCVCACTCVHTYIALSGFIRARLSLARWPFGFVSSGLCHSLLVPQHKCIFRSFLTDRLPGHLSMSLWLSSC